MTPVVGVVCFAIIIASWFGGVRYFKGISAGLVAIDKGSRAMWWLLKRSAMITGLTP